MSAKSEPGMAAAAVNVESPMLAPDQEETSPKPDAPKVEAPKVEAPKVEAPKVEASRADKPEAQRFPGKVLIMSPGERAWNGDSAGSNNPVNVPMTRNKRMIALFGTPLNTTATGGVTTTTITGATTVGETTTPRDTGGIGTAIAIGRAVPRGTVSNSAADMRQVLEWTV